MRGLITASCALMLAIGGAQAAGAATRVPLPRPRPAEAPKAEPRESTEKKGAQDKKDEEAAAEKPAPQPSACRLALTDQVAIAPTLPPINGPGGCGGDDLVRLEAVVLPDKSRVPL
jgi:hypothetical protein